MSRYVCVQIGKISTGNQIQEEGKPIPEGYTEVSDEVFAIHTEHLDWVWNGETFISPADYIASITPPPTFEQNKVRILTEESAKFAQYAANSDRWFTPEYLKKVETATLKAAKQAERATDLANYKIAKGLWDTYEAQLNACTTQEQLDSATTMNFEDAVTTAREAWWFKIKSFFGF